MTLIMSFVLHLIDSAGFYGAERVLLELLTELRHSAHPGILGCLVASGSPHPEIARRAKAAKLPVHLFLSQRGIDFKVIHDIRRFAEENDICLVHCHGYKANISCGLMIRRNFFCVSTAHGWAQDSGLKIWLYNWLDRCALKRMDYVVGVSDAVVSRVRHAGVAVAKIRKILNGVRMKPEADSQASYRLQNRYKLDPDVLLVGSVGRLAPVKGYSYLLTALQEVTHKYPNCRLIIAGDGPSRRQLEMQVANLDLDKFVQFAGFVDDMDEFFQVVDIFVMPSLSEGLPMALLEAMAHGKPCIASNVGGIPEVLNIPDLGLLVPPANPASLAKAILSLANAVETRIVMGEKAKAAIQLRFSTQRMAADYESLYNQVLGAPSSNRLFGMVKSASA
jgi:glycosyltransferase involved in cell wall biosynthesis